MRGSPGIGPAGAGPAPSALLPTVRVQPPAPAACRWIRILTAAIVLDFVLVLGCFGHRIGARDLDQFLVFHELQYWNANLFEGPKQWTPLMCSGIPLATEPQVPVFSLSMLIAYSLGPFWGIRLATAVYLAVGWLGAYLYSGICFPERLKRGLAASLFIGNGFFIARIAVGHVDFIPFLILPGALYLLHRGVEWTRQGRSALPGIQSMTAVWALAAGFALAADGSPTAILHALFWIFLYGAVLAIASRSSAPIVMLGGAALLAACLDAGYLWPMVAGQWDAPRLQPDSFTHPLALPWYMIVPAWGRFFLSANGKGHEFTVFIGPVLGSLLFIYRREAWGDIQRFQKIPLLVVVLVSFVLGMGSLKFLHIPSWLSPFDMVRPLPGFRSIGVTGRYWGFLALPLSVLSASALWAMMSAQPRKGKAALWLALLIQLGVQTTALLSTLVSGRCYQEVDWKTPSAASSGIQFIRRGDQLQGAIITPERAIIDCYDEDDIPRAEMNPGTALIRSVTLPGDSSLGGAKIRASFLTWTRIRVDLELAPRHLDLPPSGSTVEIVFNQAYHRRWTSSGGQVERSTENNLLFRCEESRLLTGPVELTFHDPISTLGWNVSIVAWMIWAVILGFMLLALGFSGSHGGNGENKGALQKPTGEGTVMTARKDQATGGP